MRNFIVKQIIGLLLFFCINTSAQKMGTNNWADSILNTLSTEQKVAQMMVLPAYSNKGQGHVEFLENQIEELEVGGLIFFQGGPGRQARMTNRLQEKSTIPLMIAMDAEWGMAMRLDSIIKYPWAMTLGAVEDSILLYELGAEWARQCRRIGVHWNFAPVLDLNTNPENPIINSRSFGEDCEMALPKALAVARGMEDHGVLSCAKHFPGHGDTDSDSHKTLPSILKSRQELDKIELKPFKEGLNQGISSVMVAHLNVPALTGSNKPTSLSRKVVTELLRDEIGFNGLAVTDALNMAGAGKSSSAGDVELQAFLAGNDILLMPQNAKAGIEQITKAVKENPDLEEELNQRVLRILKAKVRLHLDHYQPVEVKGVHEDLNNSKARELNNLLAEKTMTLLINRNKYLPWKQNKERVALIDCGYVEGKELERTLDFFCETDRFVLNGSNTSQVLKSVADYDRVVVAYYTDGTSPWKSYKPKENIRQFLNRLSLQNEFVLTVFGNPYSLIGFDEALKSKALIMAYQNMPEFEKAAAQSIFGGISVEGALPVSCGNSFPAGSGINTRSSDILSLGTPRDVSMNIHVLERIDGMVDSAISDGAMPGAQILIARKGRVVYNKTFGYHTYENKKEVKQSDLYDLASITKIAATTLSIMKMYDEGKIDLDDKLSDLLPEAKGTNKSDINVRDMLAHQAGLQAWIPFYINTLENGQPRSDIYKGQSQENFSTVVAEDIFILDSYRDSIYDRIWDSKLLTRKDYKYSDLGYYFLMEFIQQETKMSLDQYVSKTFYNPLGLSRMTYLPRKKFDTSEIVPTEIDHYFRYQLIHGHVHDQGASMLGGVGGHAGLFSNAEDLAKLMQMYLNEGSYGGKTYLKPSTIKEFTRCQFCENDNRRGVGFDKPQLEGDGPTCGCVSMLSYGHTGFTGTMAWADPDEELVYIFLSNRVYPSAENTKLIRTGLRTRIQEVIYKSIEE